MLQTWYILEDGSNANPSEVAPDDKGVLRHKDGVAVAYGDHGNPKSRGVEVGEDGLEVPKASEKKPARRQVKADDKGGANYKTR